MSPAIISGAKFRRPVSLMSIAILPYDIMKRFVTALPVFRKRLLQND